VVYGVTVVVPVKKTVVLVVLQRLLVVVAGALVEVTAGLLVVVLATTCTVVLVVSSSSPPRPKRQEGSSTGVRSTMINTTAAKQPPAAPSNLRLCSSAPRSAVRKKALSKKKRTMLTELFTNPGYQNPASADTGAPAYHQEPPAMETGLPPWPVGHGDLTTSHARVSPDLGPARPRSDMSSLITGQVGSDEEERNRDIAVMDIFRCSGGKLVEHWDVEQAVPTEMRHRNGMF
jgi:predicted SnoaL-like aldol condensation-catalyzing enzyme